MQITLITEQYAILDYVFENLVFEKFCSFFEKSKFFYRSSNGWEKVWRITDGQVLAGQEYKNSLSPHNCEIDLLSKTIELVAEKYLQKIVGEKNKDWNDFSLTPYIYPSNTKISWHNDCGYKAAAIFYSHRIWEPSWGGELMIAKTPIEYVEEIKNPFDSDYINRKNINSHLNYYGTGTYISPKPNRLVFTKGNVWHSINRVDQNAGENSRCSVVAFFS